MTNHITQARRPILYGPFILHQKFKNQFSGDNDMHALFLILGQPIKNTLVNLWKEK